MFQIDNLSGDAHQKTSVMLADNTAVILTLDFHPATQRWILGVTRDNFTIKSVALCCHPNLLRTHRRLIPFGIGCASSAADSVDPFDLSDFVSDRIRLYLLDQTNGETDVTDVEAEVFGAPDTVSI